MWDLTHPGTAGFLKAAVQNRDPRVGIRAPSLCLFYFVLHHYLMDGKGLEVSLTCSEELLLVFPRTQSAVRTVQQKHQIQTISNAPSHFRGLTISHIDQFGTLYTSYEFGHPAITL